MSRKKFRQTEKIQANGRKNSKIINSSNVVQIDDYLDTSNLPKRNRKKKVEILPKNQNQENYVLAIEDNIVTFGIGPAGTGKTMIATLMAIQALKEGKVEKIIITRPAVSVDEQHGFLPGTLIEKMAPWTRPIMDYFEEFFNPKQIEFMIQENTIEIAPLAYMRGRTFKNAFILADEIQNATPEQVKMLLTRVGENSKIVVTGDLSQHDRGYEENGLKDFIARFDNKSKIIKVVKFQTSDVERSEVVSEILQIYKE